MRYLALLLLVPLLASADLPLFREPVIVQADGVTLDVGVISDPFMIDWDGDGLDDLLVGQFYPGKVSFYKNIGTSGNPVFTFSNYLQADGTLHFIGYPFDNLCNPIERNYNSSGYLDDWDEDGYIDFIAGGYETETTTGGNVHSVCICCGKHGNRKTDKNKLRDV